MTYFLIILLSIAYSIYSGQIEMTFGFLLIYILGILFVKFVLKPNGSSVFRYYNIFFSIYALLCLLTQIELIHNPYDDFYIHNDAAWSFFSKTVPYLSEISWNNIGEKTYLNPMYSEYPLAELLFVTVAKIGQFLHIIDLRLFLRLQNVLFASLIIPIISDALLKRNRWGKFQKKMVAVFGICSYLYVGSCVFTRDTHVWFFYTLIAYLMVIPNVKLRLIKFVALIFLIVGFRFSNGVMAIIFIIAYYYKPLKQYFGNIAFVILSFLILIAYFYLNFAFEYITSELATFEGNTMDNTGGLFIKLYSLPFPLNTLVMVVYMLFMPLPLQMYISREGCSWFTLPFVLSPYICFTIIYLVLKYCKQNIMKNDTLPMLILSFFISFVCIVYGSPDLRRAFACIPSLFMAFCLIPEYNKWKDINGVVKTFAFVILPISIALSIYVLMIN